MEKTKFEVKIDQRVISSYRSPEQFGEWNEEYSNSLDGVYSDAKYSNVIYKDDFKKGDKVYVVWVEYSYGDSFGWGERNATEPVALLKTKELGEELKKKIESTKDKFSYNVELSDGKEYEVHAAWEGYFERLEEVHVDLVEIQ